MRNSGLTLVEGFALPFLLSVPQKASGDSLPPANGTI